MGASRRDKNRLTLVLRQIIHSVFDLPVGELPQGSHLPSLLIVQAGQACLLQDMSVQEPSVWLRTHKFSHQGVVKERVAGTPVGALMGTWRELRRKIPGLFDRGVLVGGLLAVRGGRGRGGEARPLIRPKVRVPHHAIWIYGVRDGRGPWVNIRGWGQELR